MSLHTGSSIMAHQLNRFSARADFEDITGEAARLAVEPHTVRLYQRWYGDQPVLIRQRGTYYWIPAYEVSLRRDVFGEKLVRV